MSSSLRFVASMAIFGSIGIVVRFIPLSSGVIALLRGLIGCACLSALLWLRGEGLAWSRIHRHLAILVLSGLALGGNWVCLFQAFKHTTVSNAVLCYYTAPLFLVLIARVVLKEKISIPKLVCIACSMVGIVLIAVNGPQALAGASQRLGILYGLLAAICYALLMCLNTLMPELSGIPRTLLQLLLATLALAPYAAWVEGFPSRDQLWVSWPWMLTLGVFHTAIGFHLFFSGMRGLQRHTIALLGYVDPLVALALSALVLQERLNGLQWVGGSLILTSTLVGVVQERLRYPLARSTTHGQKIHR